MAYKDPEKAKAYWKAYNAKRRPIAQKTARELAIEKGEAHYDTGKPCMHGHMSKRNTASRRCMACDKIKVKVRNAANPEKTKLIKKAEYDKNRDRILAQKREYRQANKDKVNALAKAYKVNKIRRLPKWIGKEEMWLIKEAYALAKLRTHIHGFSWHVDHVVPLQGELVSGLHTPENLQVIPWMETIKKKNKHTVV